MPLIRVQNLHYWPWKAWFYVGKVNGPPLRVPVRGKGQMIYQGIPCPWLPEAVHDWHEVSLSSFQHGSYILGVDRGRVGEDKREKEEGEKDRAKLVEARAEIQGGGDLPHWISVSVS